ncbi:MAG: hypothetical protein ABIK89_22120 [Planctomycetota bacterium]
MIYIGIDDTDVVGSRGTNQLARSLVAVLAGDFRCLRIVRHQLLEDPRVPCTTKNGSASITLEPLRPAVLADLAVTRGLSRFSRRENGTVPLPNPVIADLAAQLKEHMLSWYVEGSDPGLSITTTVPAAVVQFGRRSKCEFVSKEEAYEVARRHEILLEGLGGTCDGVIGALAAVGLAATGDDGRVVQLAQWPDDAGGVRSVDFLRERGVTVRFHLGGEQVTEGHVDVGKKLRPNRRRGEDVLLVEGMHNGNHQPLKALKLP